MDYEDKDTFSSDVSNEPISAIDDSSYITFKNKKSGELVKFPSKFDPKTGEDLTLTKVRQSIPDLTPVKIMGDSKGNYVPVPFERLDEFTKLGLKPAEQIESEQAAKESHKETIAGDIGYHPDKTESFLKGAMQGAVANTAPELYGAYKGVANVLSGSDFKPGYESGKELVQAITANAEKENPLSYLGGEITGGTGTALASGGTTLAPRMLAAGISQGALSGAAKAYNEEQPLENVINAGAEGGALGGGAIAAGPIVGKIANLGIDTIHGIGNLADKFLPKQSREAFKTAFRGNDIAAPEIQDAVRTMSANMAKVGPEVIDDIRSVIGAQKGELIKASPVIDHSPMLKSINEAQAAYDKLLEETGHNLKIAKGQQPFISAFTAHDQQLNKEISRKSHILESIKDQLGSPDVVLDPIKSKELKETYTSINNDIENLYHAVKNNQEELSKTLESIQNNPTYWAEKAKPILKAKNILNDAINTLETTPHDTRIVDELKQDLGQKIYVDNDDVTKTFKGREILEKVRKDAQELIENHIPEIGKKNQAYKDILNAVHPEEVYDKVLLSPSEIESITSGKPTPNAYLKFKNLNDFNQAVQENPQINPEQKQKLAGYISDMISVSKLSNLAKGVQSGQGKIPAKLGSYLSPKNNSLTSGTIIVGKGIGRLSKWAYDKLDPKTQKLLVESPKFAAEYLKTLPRGAVMGVGEEMENKQ